MDGSRAVKACCGSMSLSLDLLQDSAGKLQEATADFPRLTRVMSLRRCYQLATESEIRTAQYQLASEIEPPIRELISRAEQGLEKLQKRERTLASKAAPRPSEASMARLLRLQDQREALQQSNATLEADLQAKSTAAP